MTIAEMKHHFTHRELGIQGAVGEYAILVPLAQWEGKLCLLFETRAETLVGHQPGEADLPGLPLQGVGPDLKEDMDLSPPLHQGDQHGIVDLGPHDLRDMPHEFLFKL